jgi:hypothetical protein
LLGKQINLTGDSTTITSTNFSVDENGNMTCNNANIKGDIKSGSTISMPNFTVDANGNVVANSFSSNDATITGGKLLLFGGTESDPAFQVSSYDGYTKSIGAYLYVIGKDSHSAGITVATDYTQSGKKVIISTGSNGGHIEVGNGTIDNFFEVNGYSNRVDVNGPVYANSFNNNSKEEIKKNIELFNENALNLLKNSNIYKFNYKTEDDNEKRHIGFIIGKNYKTPYEVISQSGESIDTYSMTSVLWKAVQEQQEQIEQLQNEIKEMKGEK